MSTETTLPIEPVHVPATKAAPTERSGMSSSMFAMLLLWPLCVAGALGLWFEQRNEARMQAMIDSRPDMAVVDDIALIKLAIDSGADRYNPASVMEGIGKIVDKNGLADTVLLSQSMVMYAPPANRIHVAIDSAEKPAREITR